MFLEGAAVGGALLDGLGAGVDLLVAGLGVLGPVVDQAPASDLYLVLLAVGGDDEVVGGRRDIEARLVLRRQRLDRHAHILRQLLRFLIAEGDAAAHGVSVQR